MAFTETGNEGALNGASEVELVAAPVTGRHVVSKLSFYNGDTAVATITVAKTKGSIDRELFTQAVAPGETWQPIGPDSHVVLDDDDESLVARMSGAPATTNPEFDAAFAVVTPA